MMETYFRKVLNFDAVSDVVFVQTDSYKWKFMSNNTIQLNYKANAMKMIKQYFTIFELVGMVTSN